MDSDNKTIPNNNDVFNNNQVNDDDSSPKAIKQKSSFLKKVFNFITGKNTKNVVVTYRLYDDEINFKKVYKTYKKENKTIKLFLFKFFSLYFFPLFIIILFAFATTAVVLNYKNVSSSFFKFQNSSASSNIVTIFPNINRLINYGRESGYVAFDTKSNKLVATWSYRKNVPFWEKYDLDYQNIMTGISKYFHSHGINYINPKSNAATSWGSNNLSKNGYSLNALPIRNYSTDNSKYDSYYVIPTYYKNAMSFSVPAISISISSYFHSYSSNSPEFINIKNDLLDIVKKYGDNGDNFYSDYVTDKDSIFRTDIKETTPGINLVFNNEIKDQVTQYSEAVFLGTLFMFVIIIIYLLFVYAYYDTFVYAVSTLLFIFLSLGFLVLIFPVTIYFFGLFVILFFLLSFNIIYFFNNTTQLVKKFVSASPYKFVKLSEIRLMGIKGLLNIKKILKLEFFIFTISSIIWIVLFLFPKFMIVAGFIKASNPGFSNLENLSQWWQYGVLTLVLINLMLIFFLTTFFNIWVYLNYYFINKKIVVKINALNYKSKVTESIVEGINDPRTEISTELVKQNNPELYAITEKKSRK